MKKFKRKGSAFSDNGRKKKSYADLEILRDSIIKEGPRSLEDF